MAYIPDPLFLPVGNTDEVSASGGGDSRLYSPFSARFSPELASQAVMQQQSATRGSRTRTNPVLPEMRTLVRKELRTRGDVKGSVTSVPLWLGLAGLIVNKEWESAQSLCRAIMVYLKGQAKAGRVRLRAAGEMGTYYGVTEAFDTYLTQIRRGEEPWRAVTAGSGKKRITVHKSLWESIYDACLAVQGNTKLPFAAYSEFPIVTCPGAGGVSLKYGTAMSGKALGVATLNEDPNGCGTFCYSVKALSYPATVARLLLMTLGASLDQGRHVDTVVSRMIQERQGGHRPRILRLFVDGDFRDAPAVSEWMRGCKMLEQHGILVYGYSKSWKELLAVHKANGNKKSFWPKNFVLNLSSGSLHDSRVKNRVRKLPITRGSFTAVDPFIRLVEKVYEVKEGPAKGSRMASAVLRAYERSLYRAHRGVAAASTAKEKRAARARLKAVDASLHTRLKRYAPRLYSAWEEYESGYRQLKKKLGAYNVVAEEAVKRRRGQKAKGAERQTKIVPGTALQAMTWRFLLSLQNPGEFSCPIDCGRCPLSAIRIHDRVIRGVLSAENKKALQRVQREFSVAMARPYWLREDRMHACGDMQKRGVDILIGLH